MKEANIKKHRPLGVLWKALQKNPTSPVGWRQLAQAYTRFNLPWHLEYVWKQEERCANASGEIVAVRTMIRPASYWSNAHLLATNTVWSGLVHVLECLRIHVAREPGDWLSWLYLVRCLEISGSCVVSNENSAEIRTAVRQALEYEPLPGESGHLLAQWRLRAGLPEQALAAVRAVLLQAPYRHGSWLLQAEAQMQLGLHAEARASFLRAGQSRNPLFLALLADKLFVFNFVEESIGVWKAIVAINPNDIKARLSLAKVQAAMSHIELARSNAECALALDPGNPTALQLIEDLSASGNSRAQFDRELARFNAEGLRDNAQGSSRLLMQSLYQCHLSADNIASLHFRVGEAVAAQALENQPQEPLLIKTLPWGERRLRVGYVSGDFHRQHPVNIFMLPLLRHHDHHALEVFVYHTGTLIDEYTRQARSCVDHWREASHFDDLTLHQRIVEDQIDVLVDLAGHTSTHRLGVFAMRSAPVQISYLGYPHSTGMPFIDWIIADSIVAPPEDEKLFSERVARVSGPVFCWSPIDEYPLPADNPMRRTDAVIFGSFNNLLKLSDDTLVAWSRILHELPSAQLMLKSAALADSTVARQTLGRFAAQGIESERLILRGPSELSMMMREYLDIDVALDPFPYNGGTTSLQALWMGCPLITLLGKNFVSRMGGSFLTQLERTEWVALDVDDYVAKAVKTAHRLGETLWSRCSLRNEMRNSPLCDIDRQTRDMERIYFHAFETWRANKSAP